MSTENQEYIEDAKRAYELGWQEREILIDLSHFASLGMEAEINRALSRLSKEFVENFDGSEEQTRWLENYIKLNPGGRFSPTSVQVWKHEEGE